ncbi:MULTISPECIES: S9 family peptidase [unclassified Imperialibacter]|uniref:S9 family peptidase n=1 Tax=unclassified Imperialibacter TaxID=2629706 RepID=UPI001258EE8B|nr:MULTISPECIES: S9 family peptidase [unclassified Imperialibacter]CAD5285065.1 Dipeptidyl aminopeptidase/acylaminoacyl peptidase [Imperialibacter sp. 75]CAD5296808.1 Dipeptidyl aminopeptidase/acylaminoacyl peptidase [Imperialibacter sp. 89]VVT24115.1 Dipeptidyl aminopeptidase/acylaminoacyl peptidase [Imperialibacter sp. EC-SDR9]
MKKLLLFFLLTAPSIALHSQSLKNPSFEEVLSLQSAGSPEISPDGKNVAFTVNSTDWEENRFDTEIWLSKNGGAPFQLTNNVKSSSTSPKWSPDGQWIAFLSDKTGKTQIQVIRLEGGESVQVTDTKGSISGFEWAPDGKRIAFTQAEDKEKAEKARKEKFGGFEVEDAEYNLSRLWLTTFDPEELFKPELPKDKKDTTKKDETTKILLDSVSYTVTSFLWSPDGTKIAFNHQPDPIITSFIKSDISIVEVATRKVTPLVKNESSDGLEAWSPDGQWILYSSYLSDTTSNFYKNEKLFRIKLDGSENTQLAKSFDENMGSLVWNAQGIFGIAYQKTVRRIFFIDPDNGKFKPIFTTPARIYAMSFTGDGEAVAFSGVEDNSLTEIYTSPIKAVAQKKLTHFTGQLSGWATADSEVISWKSKDGATIEGILSKPKDYDPKKKYPLLVIIHGGPTGISTPSPVASYVYPLNQWINKGALILQPNYRGSAGYGEAFRSLNVENLGVGDAWDVISGVESLEKKGMIDSDKIGCMGWSQGGYISAFLTTNSDKFKAISVGAGISNWVTYYVNTDIHPFTRQYLKATPWANMGIYLKTSPMTNINNAKTPTLIQHGEFDKRVPIPNAYELYQGLQDVGVETRLVVYKGFGHGITKPKERLAAVWHNWQWFGEYIWSEEIEVPEE